MPFEKGQSGNKKGKPKGTVSHGLRERRERMQKDTPQAQRLLRKAMKRAEDELDASESDLTGFIDMSIVTAGVRAAEQVLTWAYGKPSPWPNENGIPPDIARLPVPEQRHVIQEHVQAWLAADAALERMEKRMQPEEQVAKEEMQ